MSRPDRHNRAAHLDFNFLEAIKTEQFPVGAKRLQLLDLGLEKHELIELFQTQVSSRLLDIRARELKNESRCFYTIGSSGHENNAVFGKVFPYTDMAFLHYRSQAFQIQRSKQLPGTTPIYDALLSLVASSDDPISGGRHKVIGSKLLNIPPQTSTIASHLPKAVGAALSIPRARDLKIPTVLPSDAMILCSFGDASINHATAQTAINAASWVSYQNFPLPLVFICEDNGVGISTKTPQDWIKNTISQRPGIKYIHANGLDVLDTYRAAKEAEAYTRKTRKPCFIHMQTVRLLAHAGSDPEWSYHDFQQIEDTEKQDPLLHTARVLLENNILQASQIENMYQGEKQRIYAISEQACLRPKLLTSDAVKESITSCANPRAALANVSESERQQVFEKDFEKLHTQPQHMAKLINYGLADILLKYKNTLVFGEDVAKKGGVYNVTDGLYKKFGPRRVFNSPLDETTIIGSALGFAHNGFVPIPEIQFLAYLHNAEDQLRGEAATLSFFSQGLFTNPMVLRIAGLPYQKGFGGHFHNDNSLSVLRDIPGLIIAIPSQGAEAVKMLRSCVRAAYEKGRVSTFIEPIALYMTKDLHEIGDKAWSFNYPEVSDEIPIGQADYSDGPGDVLVITYANGVYFSEIAKKILKDKYSIKLSVLNLRWIAPLDWESLIKAAGEHSRVIIFDECRKTGSLSEALIAGLYERLHFLPKIKVLAADDCFIPLGVAAAAGLPSSQDIIAAAEELMRHHS